MRTLDLKKGSQVDSKNEGSVGTSSKVMEGYFLAAGHLTKEAGHFQEIKTGL